MTRALLALFMACAGLLMALYASGVTAQNQDLAAGLHYRERMSVMRAAAIEEMFIRVRGRVVGDSEKSNVQNGGAVSDSLNLGGSQTPSSDVSTPIASGAQAP